MDCPQKIRHGRSQPGRHCTTSLRGLSVKKLVFERVTDYSDAMRTPAITAISLQKLRSFSSLCALLVLLLIANSSQALEVLAHGSHGHDSVSHESLITMDIAQDLTENCDSCDHHASHPQNNTQPEHDDCFCDELCSLSSLGFGSALLNGPMPASASVNGRLPDYYQSISLDLLLPPPTL